MQKDENATRAKIKAFLAFNGVTLTDVVKAMNERYPDEPTTQQNLTNKLARETIKFSEVMKIADILEYDVVFKKRSNSKSWIEPHAKKQAYIFYDVRLVLYHLSKRLS